MSALTTERTLQAYQKAVNEIEDFLEYRYRGCTQMEMRDTIMESVTKLSDKIIKIWEAENKA